MNIEDIKATMENLETGVFDRTTGTKELFLPMFEHLLSIIEQAEKALKSAQADISSLTLAFEEETTSNTTIEEVIEDGRMSKSWIEIIEALQAIKGDK